MHGEVPANQRAENFAAFKNHEAQVAAIASHSRATRSRLEHVARPACAVRTRPVMTDRLRDAAQVMVCTDLAARGLDNLEIAHVIQFDFPKTATDYMHRAGRTARFGAKGIVTNFVGTHDRPLAMCIQEAHRTGGDIMAAAEAHLVAHQKKQAQKKIAALSNAAARRERRGAVALYHTIRM